MASKGGPKDCDDLNLKQKKFADLYITPDKEFFGNGVESYVEAYDVDMSKPNWYKSAAASASRLLKNVKVCEYINHKLEVDGLNDEFVDKQLSFLIVQHADFKTKLGAIKEYNALKQRITQRIDHTTKGESLNEKSKQELDNILTENTDANVSESKDHRNIKKRG